MAKRSTIIDASNILRQCVTELLDSPSPRSMRMAAETASLAHATARRLVAEIDELQTLLRRPKLDVADYVKLSRHTVTIKNDDPQNRKQ